MTLIEQNVSHAVLFPGQGSQQLGMAESWARHSIGKDVLDETADLIGSDIVAGCHDETLLATTAFVQPALLACEVAAFRILDESGVEFLGGAGHSMGEFSVLVAADVVSLEDAVRILQVRGEAMQQASQYHPGAMAALVGVERSVVGELCKKAAQDDILVIANENSPKQTVISGSIAAIERASQLAKERKIRTVRLAVAGAFHSPLMQDAVEPIKAALAKTTFHIPRFPVAENVTGTLINEPSELKQLVERHVISPVKWESSIRALGAAGINTFIELGPGNVLSKLMKQILPDAPVVTARSYETLTAALALMEV